MERGISVIFRFLPALFTAALFCVPSPVRAGERVVLVTSERCTVSRLTSLDLRKIYFGFTIEHDHQIIRAYRNLSDARLEQIFLQNVVAMSKKSYRRRLLWLRLNNGNANVDEFKTVQEFLADLDNWPCAITYLWERQITPSSPLKILDGLWQSD